MRTSATMWLTAAALVAALSLDALAETRPSTQWRPAAADNYTQGRGGNPIRYVVIHTVEGSALGAVSWFANSASNVSAHYVVSYTGTIYQCVADSNTGWHAGNWTYNQQSIGIEHEGYTNQNRWTDAQYRASAAMTRWICATYGVARDRSRIIGHIEVPGATHTDPGPYFNWTYYMQLVNGGSSPPPPPPPSPSLTAQQVTATTLNVRSGAGTGFSIIGSVRNGQIYVANATSNGWHRIYYDNRQGWCSSSYLTRRTGGVGRRITASSLNVRTGPGTGYSITGSCTSGEVFVANTLQSGWLRIYYRGGQFWISAQYTTTVQF